MMGEESLTAPPGQKSGGSKRNSFEKLVAAQAVEVRRRVPASLARSQAQLLLRALV